MAHHLWQPDEVADEFCDMGAKQKCKAVAAGWRAIMDYLVTPSPLPTHRTWSQLGTALEELHTEVALPYVAALRDAMGLQEPVRALEDAPFRAKMAEGACTPALLSERIAQPPSTANVGGVGSTSSVQGASCSGVSSAAAKKRSGATGLLVQGLQIRRRCATRLYLLLPRGLANVHAHVVSSD